MGKRLKIGDRVRINWGGKKRRATVIEDRGDIGVGGRQLVTVRVGKDGEPFTMPAEELRRAGG